MRGISTYVLTGLVTVALAGCADPKPEAPMLESMGKSQANINEGKRRAMQATADESFELSEGWKKDAIDEYGEGMSIDDNNPDEIMQGP